MFYTDMTTLSPTTGFFRVPHNTLWPLLVFLPLVLQYSSSMGSTSSLLLFPCAYPSSQHTEALINYVWMIYEWRGNLETFLTSMHINLTSDLFKHTGSSGAQRKFRPLFPLAHLSSQFRTAQCSWKLQNPLLSCPQRFTKQSSPFLGPLNTG